jgi:hypothetical protein
LIVGQFKAFECPKSCKSAKSDKTTGEDCRAKNAGVLKIKRAPENFPGAL